jgi:hypothetical protein
MIEDVKKIFDKEGILYFDSMENNLPSETFGDTCHLLREGHEMLARNMVNSPSFRKWLTELNIIH